jgi:hypothetical protein
MRILIAGFQNETNPFGPIRPIFPWTRLIPGMRLRPQGPAFQAP